MKRRAVLLAAGVAMLSQVALGAVAQDGDGHDHASHSHRASPMTAAEPVELPARDPARGVVLDGLRAVSSGPCVGLLEVVDDDAAVTRCTHGPDLAPPDGVDVRTADMSVAEARAIVATAPDFTCAGDGTSGRRAHAIYAHTPDRADRFATHEETFKAIVADVQEQFRESSVAHGASDPLVFRFVHTAPSGGTCQPVVDSVDLPANDDDDSFANTVDALEALGYTRSDRRYLVFVDANQLCGIGHLYGDDRPSPTSNWNNVLSSPLFSRVDAGCWNYAEAHELAHNIGAVQYSAPNTSGGGHCNDDYDVMCYADGGSSSSMFVSPDCTPRSTWERRLDCGGDDYFHPDPPAGSYLADHWNIADSSWLFTEVGSGGGGTTRPWVSVTSPAEGSTVLAPVTVRGRAGDVDGDLDRVVVRVDGTVVRTIRPTGSNWTASISPPSGTTTVKVTAYDDGGRSKSSTRTFTTIGDLFVDDDGSIFEPDIQVLAYNGVTRGCNPPTNNRFCPDAAVTRGAMAAFLTRALDLPAGTTSFVDSRRSPFADDISSLARAGITRGCNPPSNDRFCPDDEVTRGQMAAFVTRALALREGASSFRDTSRSPFVDDIAALADAGITRGCNPPSNDRFCPDDVVTRAQMAAFLVRALYS